MAGQTDAEPTIAPIITGIRANCHGSQAHRWLAVGRLRLRRAFAIRNGGMRILPRFAKVTTLAP
ncbi:MAG: hypothetical protein WCY32_11195 [Burkholderiaceae bacterium]